MPSDQSPPAQQLAHFLAIPWCAEHLTRPGIEIVIPPGRKPQDSNEDELWFKTLNTPETFPAFITYYKKPQYFEERIDEVSAFVTAEHGVQGFPNIMQGGIVVTLLDGIAGLIPGLNRPRHVFPAVPFVTAYINTKFLHSTRIPGTFLLKAWIIKVEGRRLSVGASIQDERGMVLANADVLFIETKPKL